MPVRWAVLLAAMWVSWFDFGLQTTMGTLFLPLLNEFGEGRSATASVQSTFIGINQGLGVFAGLLISRFGITKVVFTGSALLPLGFFFCYFSTSLIHINICISILSAVGVSLMFVSSAVMLSRTFPQRQLPVAIAFHSASIGLSGFTYPYIMNYILENFQLHGTFLILSAFLLNNLPVSIFFSYTVMNAEKKKAKRKLNGQRFETFMHKANKNLEIPKANDMTTHGTDENKIEVYSISKNHKTHENETGMQQSVATRNDSTTTESAQLKTMSFNEIKKSVKRKWTSAKNYLTDILSVPYVAILIATGLIIASQNGYLSLLIDIFESKGYTHNEGLNAFLPLNLCGLVARLLPGFLRHIHGLKLLALAIFFTICGSVGQLVIWLAPNYTIIMIGVGLTGIPMGGVVCVASIVVIKLVGIQKFPVSFGLVLTTVGVLATICGPLYGAIRDSFDSYAVVLIIDASVQMLGSALFLIAFLSGKKRLKLVEKDSTLNKLVSSVHKTFYFGHMY